MTALPLVSVVVPVYNQEEFIEDCLTSILSQTYRNLEVIVVDDNSTDKTREKVQRFGNVKLIKLLENSGPSFARNMGVNKCQGQILAFCDGDDIWRPEKIENQLKFHLTHGIDLSATGYENIGQNISSERFVVVPNVLPRSWMVRHPLLTPFPPSVMMMSTEKFRAVGGWNNEIRHGEDLDLVRRAVFSGLSVRILEDVLSFQRIHKNNLSNESVIKKTPSYMRIIKSWIVESSELRVSEALIILYEFSKSIIKTLIKEGQFRKSFSFFFKLLFLLLEIIFSPKRSQERQSEN